MGLDQVVPGFAELADLVTMLRTVADAGGVSVIAHPWASRYRHTALDGSGLETYQYLDAVVNTFHLEAEANGCAREVIVIAVSTLTKYFGVTLFPLLIAYGVMLKRRPGVWLLPLIIPAADGRGSSCPYA